MVTLKVSGGNVTVRPTGILFFSLALFLTIFLITSSYMNLKVTGFYGEDSIYDEDYQGDVGAVFRRIARNDGESLETKFEEEKKIWSDLTGSFYGNIKIDPRVVNIPDTRSLLCKYKVYDFSNILTSEGEDGNQKMIGVSLILVFNDYEFFELRKTVESILMSKCMPFVREMLVVDDASTLAYIQEEAQKFFASVPRSRLFKTSLAEPMGLASARNLAASEAKGDLLVFVSSSAVVGPGWLEPLIHQLEENPNVIAVPHIDQLKDPISMEYEKVPDDHTYTLTWSLSIRPFEAAPSRNKNNGTLSAPLVIDSPALRGDVFAVKRATYIRLGGYDPNLEDYGGGEHVDLSLKAWLCGDGIKTLLCSRIGVVNSHDPVKVRSELNRKRLADIWFPEEEYHAAIYRLVGSKLDDISMDYHDINDASSKPLGTIFSLFFQPSSNCKKPIKWYLDEIAVNMVKLRKDAVAYGILKTGTNKCAHLLKVDPQTIKALNNNLSNEDLIVAFKVKLDNCKRAVLYDPRIGKVRKLGQGEPRESESVFQITKNGRIMVGDDYCLTTKVNGYVAVERCRPVIDDKQRFYYKEGLLLNVWCGYCVMQVTDPDASISGDRQIAMVQSCDAYSNDDKSFKTWTFINL